MNKKLLVLALAAGFAVPAMADVTISGAFNAGPAGGHSNDGTAAAPAGVTSLGGYGAKGGTNAFITSNYSNFNLASTEDLGNGLKVVLNYQVDASNTGAPIQSAGTGTLRSRNSYLGLAGDWGSVKWGSNEHIYEQLLYKSDPLDGAAGVGGNLNMMGTPGGNVFTNVNCGLGGGGGCAQFYRRTENSIWYDSPNIGGFTGSIAWGMPQKTFNAVGTNQSAQVLSVGGKFAPTDLPFYVDAAVERHSDYNGMSQIANNTYGAGGISNSTDTGMQVGGGVMFGDLTVGARFENLKYKADGVVNGFAEWKRNAFTVTGKYGLPTGYVGAQFVVAQDAKTKTAGTETFNGNKTGAMYFAAGYYHNLSKQTQAQFVLSFLKNKDNANYINIGQPNGGRGTDSTAFYVGLKHAF